MTALKRTKESSDYRFMSKKGKMKMYWAGQIRKIKKMKGGAGGCTEKWRKRKFPIRKVWWTQGVPVTGEKLKETDSNCPISTSNKPWLFPPGESALHTAHHKIQQRCPPMLILTPYYRHDFFSTLTLSSISLIIPLSNSLKHCTGYTIQCLSPV